jgi:hypothetical protein
MLQHSTDYQIIMRPGVPGWAEIAPEPHLRSTRHFPHGPFWHIWPHYPVEVRCASVLGALGLWWSYETVRIWFGFDEYAKHTKPDFFVPAHDLLIECKDGSAAAGGGAIATALGFRWGVVRGNLTDTAMAALILSKINGTRFSDEVEDAEAIFGPLAACKYALQFGFVWPKGEFRKAKPDAPPKVRPPISRVPTAYKIGMATDRGRTMTTALAKAGLIQDAPVGGGPPACFGSKTSTVRLRAGRPISDDQDHRAYGSYPWEYRYQPEDD